MPYYILKDKQVTPATFHEWLEFNLHEENFMVAQTQIQDVKVSTIFVGVGFSSTSVQYFETMTFSKTKKLHKQARYATYEDALKGHQQICETVLALYQ